MPSAQEPTEDQLQAAWQRLRRPEWGSASFEADKAAALRWARVRLAALHPRATTTQEQAHDQAPAHPRTADPRPAAAAANPPARRTPAQPTQLPIFDRKRAAAGDRDDDDERCPF